MKISKKTLLGLATITAVAVVVVYLNNKQKNRAKLKHIADEGYEFANDILYPNKLQLAKNLRYGPVLPE